MTLTTWIIIGLSIPVVAFGALYYSPSARRQRKLNARRTPFVGPLPKDEHNYLHNFICLMLSDGSTRSGIPGYPLLGGRTSSTKADPEDER